MTRVRVLDQRGQYQVDDLQSFLSRDTEWEEDSYRAGCAVARQEAERKLACMEERLHEGRPGGWRVEGWRWRTLMTKFGEIRLKRRLYKDEGGRAHFLLDEHLGWESHQMATPSVTQSVVRLSSQLPFREVEETIAELTAGVLSTRSIHSLVQKVGDRAVADEEQAWRACFEEGRDVGEGERGVEVLYTEADGVWVHLQRESQAHYEIKSGIAYEGWEKISLTQDRYGLLEKRVYCHANEEIPFWEGASVEWSKVYDLSKVGTVVVGGDGANWVEAGKGEFAHALMQLDGFHLARACGRGFGKELGHQVYEAIRAGQTHKANQLMDEAAPTDSKATHKARRYVKANVIKGVDWRNKMEEVPVDARSLGTMESNGDKLVANRMKKRGMSWTIKGAQHMAKVIQLRANRELASVCQRRTVGKPASEEQCRSPLRSWNGRRAHGQWLQVTIPALTGPHHSRSWVQALHTIAHLYDRLN